MGVALSHTAKMDESRSSNELAAAVSSTVIVFLVISILTFITEFVFGHYFQVQKYKESSKKTQDINPVSSQPDAPLYEDVDMLPSAECLSHYSCIIYIHIIILSCIKQTSFANSISPVKYPK